MGPTNNEMSMDTDVIVQGVTVTRNPDGSMTATYIIRNAGSVLPRFVTGPLS